MAWSLTEPATQFDKQEWTMLFIRFRSLPLALNTRPVTRRLLRKDSWWDTTTSGEVDTITAAPAEVNTTHIPVPKIYLAAVDGLATSNTTPPFPPRTTRQLKIAAVVITVITAAVAVAAVYEGAPRR